MANKYALMFDMTSHFNVRQSTHSSAVVAFVDFVRIIFHGFFDTFGAAEFFLLKNLFRALQAVFLAIERFLKQK
jgi:hypothetical protein